ncbi:UDP-N-acetylglucosamine--N-acetylmuramyl-(pentapeptide) pyrophosphoryl-undecaprenol N-acetylglucosamine transferase [Enterobacter hormaechei]|uniref:ribbon-helix-helix protein, CopG family n=1 Tax=Enterobacter hormaechei TaxID=158836 RepID=UPI00136F8B8B|nr:ribbon-helix-helix protein, CopG family [Enterobacter hormaechei]NAJ00284.1 tellurium resistance protein TerW [Escherichia coli]EHF5018930.1 UDP-N-acetylglucosamine--N-acetylmuramyl-(pentapeptide) pyrophosphoryl-undecaprenol N-acetylglucosamine transferase [Enterobacter hormaechei]MZJ54443.1 tellurium resistance protein TerW [Enterobacter hormaechei]MZJ74881.1 tellurium resistance protein TerW [Enterobacter hormaechei]MZK04152.1 tellurium resistance protein TerW [Enterobacter hormaechei]
MGSCAAPSAKGDDKFITTDYLQQCREDYSAEIKYSKASHSYQMITPGNLDKKTLRRMSDDLAKNAELKSTESGGRVILDKDKKTAVSLSLRMKILRKIDRLADMEGLSRSEAVEKITERVIDELLKESRENEKIRKNESP